MTELDGRGWGGPARMSPAEALMWRAEGDLRTRSSGALVELLDTAPDWDRFLAAHERATRAIPRLRERVVEPLLPVVEPTWTEDTHFDLNYHVQRIRLPEPGTLRQLLDLAGQVTSRPLDPNRPQWEAILVEGLEDGRAGYLLKIHHAMSDGLGMVQLLGMAHSERAAPGGAHLPAMAAAPGGSPTRLTGVTPLSLVADRLLEGISDGPARLVGAAGQALGLLGRALRDPAGTVERAVDYSLSLRRMLTPPAAQRSPLLRGGGFGYRLTVHDVLLDELKKAGKAAGGSVNDAFLAGVLGAFRRYHEHFGQQVDHMPMAIPISLRDSSDPMGGNRFAGARFVAPLGEPDPAARIQLVREFILNVRAEPAIAFLDLLTPVLSKLPSPVLTELTAELTKVSDVQASNIPGLGHPVYLAGAKVLRMYPIGPRPGVTAMVTMVSYDGTCCIGVNFDPEAITDLELFESCLRDGFDEVLALGR
ncbi:MAG TPA: wax ester/triacylglycerol synthase domain-containing protein [Pseudonocardia sp.]|uniref:wax ester/triacylglycerol synthase domain-containing protein n=1 Tax=Pseudonocardia sp. TaxID=60912 RepID=UPI002C010235|nr:wax ester/triacylglycerol synthase domain-containing protein [Pseudonocardia sp.]HTF45819.1 wax ester/triacylglycerol synthase domain-containing protein [Pseudonocardia sp.]